MRGLAGGLSGLMSILMFGGCMSCGLCGNDEITRATSPDGVLEAVLFQRDCGATTGFTTQVAVVGKGEALMDAPGNIFVADDGHGAAPAAAWGGPPAEVQWLGPRMLLVRYHAASRVAKSAGNVRVSVGWFATTRVETRFEPAEGLVGPSNNGLNPTACAGAAVETVRVGLAPAAGYAGR